MNFEILLCNLFEFGRVQNFCLGKGLNKVGPVTRQNAAKFRHNMELQCEVWNKHTSIAWPFLPETDYLP